MRRNEYTHRRRHISNRHLSDKYYYAGEHETATGIRLTQYNEQSLHTKEVRITDTSFSKLSDSDQINWFEVSGLTNADAITRIVKDFGLHNLDAKGYLDSPTRGQGRGIQRTNAYRIKLLLLRCQ